MWEFGSDDLFFPGIFSATIRALWFVGLLGGVVYFRNTLWCEQIHYLIGVSIALLVIALLAVVLEVVITALSTRGTIIRARPRRFIVHLLYARVLVLILEVFVLIIGTAFSVVSRQESERLDCPYLNMAITMIQVVLGCYWFVFIVLVIVVTTYLDPCHCYSAKVNYSQVTMRLMEGSVDQEVVETQWKLVHTVWEKRFKVACCIAGSDDVHQLAYREVAEIFAHLFCDTNVVLSDIGAGLILLQKEHLALEETERKNRRSNIKSDDEPDLSFDFHYQEDRDLFRDAMHFMKYALGMYSWPFYVYMNPFCGLCRLYTHLNCCGRRNEAPHIHDDNRCSCYLGGLRQFTGLNEGDIIYVSFENDVYMVPYTVCLDHEMKSVVIGFRGTLSFGDIVTDLTASTKPMELPNYPNFLVHKGMLKTATTILEKLDEEQILESAFSKVPGYKLVLAGHSLGAGCACVMAMLLKERYPDLRCFCYSPTGSQLNKAAAIFTEDFVTSVTLGSDLIARMNVANTHKLKDDLVRVIESCKKPKCQILLEGCLETLCTCLGGSLVFGANSAEANMNVSPSDASMEEQSAAEDENGNGESNPLLVSISIDPEESLSTSSLSAPPPPNGNSATNKNSQSAEITPILNPRLSSLKLPVRSTGRRSSPVSSLTQEVARRLVPLYPPGKILHIVDRSKNRQCFCNTRQLEIKWAHREDFSKISVSPDMVRDHFPDVLNRAMDKIWNKKQADMEDSEIRRHHQAL